MAKKVLAIVKLQLPAGKGKPAPRWSCPGSARRQHHGLLQGNTTPKTANMAGSIIPVEIIIYQDKSFTLALKTPACY